MGRKRESIEGRKKRGSKIYAFLKKTYPDAHCALHYRNPYELMVATILSAQCTDKRVNMVTPELFRHYPTPEKMARAPLERIEELIRSTGFFRNKAKSISESAREMVKQFNGKVPQTMEALLTLRGVARKTANVILGTGFNINVGVVVDTHIGRLSRRMGFTREKDPVKVEKDLMKLFPRKDWTMLGHLLIWHGRNRCPARKPDCDHCEIKTHCPKVGV